MNKNHHNKVILVLSLPLSVLIILVSCVGLLSPGFYSAETLNWQAQSVGQDMIDLFLLVPGLLITSILSYRNNRTATMAWGAVVLYLTYTFVLYCFNVHFNKLFVLYCFCLGLSFYSFMYFLLANHKAYKVQAENNTVTRIIGIYFIVIAVLFYFLWLSEIIPAIVQNVTPKSISDTGLFTNGVQVIDLSVFLPGIFITGVFLLRKKPIGFLLTPVILGFFILMDTTIGVLAVAMKMKGLETNLMLPVIMGLLALISLALLAWYLRSLKYS
jgi:hypothetical protein